MRPALLVALVVLAASCGESYPAGSSMPCAPGAGAACACAGGANGERTCGPDRTWSDCGCPCASHGECAAGTACADPDGDGVGICVPGCRADADCGTGWTCLDEDGDGAGRCVCACDHDAHCDSDCSCDPDCVVRECRDHEDCYPNAYCTSSGDYCHSLARCPSAASRPEPEAHGPMLYAFRQLMLSGSGNRIIPCRKDPATCTDNGNVCAFTVEWYDPEGDVATDRNRLYLGVRFLFDGGESQVYDVGWIEHGEVGGSFAVYGCFDESNRYPSGAIYVRDELGHASNAICFEGGGNAD